MNDPRITLNPTADEISELKKQISQLEQRCTETEEALDAIRSGAVDALVVYTPEGEKIYTIQGAETTYRLMIEAINEGVATLIEDGTILYCNRRFAEMLHMPLESVIGSSIHHYIPEEHLESFNNLLNLAHKENCREETELLYDGDERIPVMISLNNFSSSGVPGLCLVATDLTDRKIAAKMSALVESKTRVEEKLRSARDQLERINEALLDEITEHMHTEDELKESRRKYQDLIETTSEFIWEMDNQGRYTYCSPQMESLWGLKPEEMIGKTPIEVMPPGETEKSQQGFKEVASSASPFRELLSTSYNSQGELIFIETSGNPYFDQDGQFLGFRGITRDITERTRAEEKLRKAYDELEQRVQERTKELRDALDHEQTMRLQLIQAEKLSALNRMLATVIHELNNPIQTIKNCIYLTKMDAPPDSPLLDPLDIADSEINRISNLVSALREIYRQPKNINKEYLDINKLISDVHTLLNPHLQHQNVTWQLEASADPLMIYGIIDHLKQVFLNISMNAIEAMQPDGGMLIIRTALDRKNNEAVVRITDTGCGIEPTDIQRLFEPFFTTKEGGSGLGLSICYEIIQNHAGRISVESQPGKGTTFTIYLPATQVGE